MVICPGAWNKMFRAKYGSIPEFLRAHPEAFYRCANDTSAFYRPEAPARLPAPSAWPAMPAGAGVTSRALHPVAGASPWT